MGLSRTELERKVGQQTLEIDFLKGCLQEASFDLGSESVSVPQPGQPVGISGQLQEGLGNHAEECEGSILPDL
jgi:hypothetical protein